MAKFLIEELKTSTKKPNINREESIALRELQSNKNIIIKQADKGGTVVITDRDYYANKILEILKDDETYMQRHMHTDEKIIRKIERLSEKYKDELIKGEKEYLTKLNHCMNNFYGLPKIHKSQSIITHAENHRRSYLKSALSSDLSFRPIVGGPICPTNHLSNLIDINIKPVVTFVKSNLRDGIKFINKLPRNVPNDTILTSFDIIRIFLITSESKPFSTG